MNIKRIKIGKRWFNSILAATRYYKKPYMTFLMRLHHGWSKLEAAQTPVRKYDKIKKLTHYENWRKSKVYQ